MKFLTAQNCPLKLVLISFLVSCKIFFLYLILKPVPCSLLSYLSFIFISMQFYGPVDTFFTFGIQLRNLIWASSKHDVYLLSNYSVMHWSSLTGNLSEILNFSGHIAPAEVLFWLFLSYRC